ncbi:MAG: aromatic amino acid lyase [Acidobacteriota bacterium]|nr:aromatic amino acid lyase [Acidobacteriota bacterium]
MSDGETIVLSGSGMSIVDLVRIARDPSIRVGRTADADARITRAERVVEAVASSYIDAWERKKLDPSVQLPREYGVTTGFGEFKDKSIPPAELEELQRNLLLSHSVGVGENTNRDDLSNYYPPEVVRGALVTRFNAFLKGHSGVRGKLVDILQAMLNTGIVPLVPLRGSVGASGDLCPLSHLFVTLLDPALARGHELGYFYRVRDEASMRNTRPEIRPASEMLGVLQEEIQGLTRKAMQPTYKEGLGLANGANFSSAMLALGVHDAMRLAEASDIALSMTLEAIGGSARAFDAKVHAAREHPGQITSAGRVRELLATSGLIESAGAVQDVYSIRCAPQVHGASRDAIDYVAEVARREINSATDNPLFFPDGDEPWDLRYRENWPKATYDGSQRQAYSAGNFHGQPIALAADFLTIALAELASISERRTQLLLDGHHNRNLPENLTTRAGVNSGFMIAQYTAASLVSENKVLSHPASVDSIPTSANTEDHVSMSTHAARKMRTVLGNAQSVLAIELLTASQALEWRIAFNIPATNLGETEQLEYRPANFESANTQAKDFEERVSKKAETIATSIAERLRPAYRAVRKVAAPVLFDRPLDDDIRSVRELVASGVLLKGRN